MNTTPYMVRHGDLLIREVERIPEKAKRVKHGILAEGEATGHAHRVDTKQAKLFERDGKLYLRTGAEGAALTHEEHARIDLPADCCLEVIRQREYVAEDIVRQVAD